MRAGRANRLARRARRRRSDGTLTWWARRAWVRLAAAVAARDGIATMAVRRAWLAEPRDDTWQYVSRVCTPADLFAAAVAPDRDAGSRAAIGAYCIRHDVVPENPVEGALFFVLTGQHQRYQALDPDGTLLTSAYRGAAEATREALRHTMTGLGELSLVRVIADRSGQALAGVEADYLAGQLADVHDWERLWRLIPTMPLASAVRAARLFPDWRPADDLGRAFFARLAGTDPDAITALGQAAVTRLDRVKGKDWFYAPSFAPDNSEISLGGMIFALPSGRVVEDYDVKGQELALGDATIVHRVNEAPYGLTAVRNAPGRPPETLLRHDTAIDRTPDGFVAAADGKLWFGNATGSWSRVAPVELPIGDDTSNEDLHAADPVSGNLVFVVKKRDTDDDDHTKHLVLVDANQQVLAVSRSYDRFRYALTFVGPEQILVENLRGDVLELWRRHGTDLVLAATADLGFGPAPLLARNLVVVRRDDRLVWLDAGTLVEVDPPAGFPVRDSRMVSFSLDGSLAAVEVEGRVVVYDLRLQQLADLAARSLSQARVVDLETADALRKGQLASPAGEVVELLRAGLVYRFGAEIALGSGTRIAGTAHDIALGGQ